MVLSDHFDQVLNMGQALFYMHRFLKKDGEMFPCCLAT